MSAIFIQSWPCTRAAKTVSVKASCPIAHLFGQSIDQKIVEEIDMWIQSNCQITQMVYEGKYKRDEIHNQYRDGVPKNDDHTAVKFTWQYSKNTASTLRVQGIYLPQGLVEKLRTTNLVNHFYDFSAVYDGYAVQINCVSTQ